MDVLSLAKGPSVGSSVPICAPVEVAKMTVLKKLVAQLRPGLEHGVAQHQATSEGLTCSVFGCWSVSWCFEELCRVYKASTVPWFAKE